MEDGAIAQWLRSRGPGRALLALAAPAEARAALRALNVSDEAALKGWKLHALTDRLDLVVTGVSKANAAGAVARTLDPGRHAAVLSVGIAGALPGSGLAIGSVVLADASLFADEGLLTPAGFQDCAAMGFPIGPGGIAVPAAEDLLPVLRPLADAHGPVATVSICSGTDAQAAAVQERTAALAEAMEGAAVGVAAARAGVPFAEVRVISNTTGDRERQIWDLPGALRILSRLIGRL